MQRAQTARAAIPSGSRNGSGGGGGGGGGGEDSRGDLMAAILNNPRARLRSASERKLPTAGATTTAPKPQPKPAAVPTPPVHPPTMNASSINADPFHTGVLASMPPAAPLGAASSTPVDVGDPFAPPLPPPAKAQSATRRSL